MELRDPEFSEDFVAYTSINTMNYHSLTLAEDKVKSNNFRVLVHITLFPEFSYPFLPGNLHQTLLKNP